MDECNHLDTLIEQDRCFAIYRIPGDPVARFILQNSGSIRLFHRLEELNGQSGFVIAPFRVSKKYPIVLIEPESDHIPAFLADDRDTSFSRVHPSVDLPQAEEVQRQYENCFRIFTRPLLKGELNKLVLSRRIVRERPEKFSPASAFRAACRRYTRSYVYLCHTPQTGTWLGSTPEILLAGKEGTWQTVALAGTQRLHEGGLPESWDEKNREEQQIVAAYIRRQLASLDIYPREEGPYTARAGELTHLKSDFYFSLPDPQRLGDMLNLLHPTPAVCGLPKQEAYRFILAHEGYERSYYSGFIGLLDPANRTDLYVNLRCMHVRPRLLTLYAGGGLLASSSLADEWQETEDKLQTMKMLLETD